MHSVQPFGRRLALLAALLFFAAAKAYAGSASTTIEPREIAALTERAVARQVRESPLARGATRIETAALAIDSRLRLDACEHPLEVDVDLGRLQRRISAKVSCNAPRPWSIYVPTELRIYRQVVVSSRDLQSGIPLTINDIGLAERDIVASANPTLPTLDQAVGYALRRPLGANSVITANLLQQPVMVRRGDRLNIHSRSGGIEVQAMAEALEDGRSGDRIRVKNLQSQRVVDVTITGHGEARTP